MEDETVVSIAGKHSKTAAQIMLRFLVQNGVAAIPKSISANRIKENIDVFDFELDESDVAALKRLDRGQSGRLCDMKG